jgi:hypothetical protein
MRPADHHEISAVVRFDYPAQIAAMLLHTSGDMAFCAYINGEPVTVFGVSALTEVVACGWAYGTNRLKRTIPKVTAFALGSIAPELVRRGFHRLEVRTYIGHDLSHKWLEGMGFEREGVSKAYGLNGEDFAVYAATKPRA